MLRVGLSGGIGSGKSTVSRRLVEHGAILIDSDVLAREVVAPGSDGLDLIRGRFGDHVIGADGALDRPALGQVVFGDEDARTDLNAIIHPRVLEETQQRMAGAPADAVVVHDIPLLVELDRAGDYHLTVIVGAAQEVRLRRLIADRGMTEADAQARIAAQASDEQRHAAADVWLSNEADLPTLLGRVDALWSDRLLPFEENVRAGTPARWDRAARVVDPSPVWAPTAQRLLGRVRRQVVQVGLAEQVTEYAHVGGTALPDRPAQDVIDLQITVDSFSVVGRPQFETAMLAAGFAREVPEASAPSAGEGTATYGACDPGRAARLVCQERSGHRR